MSAGPKLNYTVRLAVSKYRKCYYFLFYSVETRCYHQQGSWLFYMGQENPSNVFEEQENKQR